MQDIEHFWGNWSDCTRSHSPLPVHHTYSLPPLFSFSLLPSLLPLLAHLTRFLPLLQPIRRSVCPHWPIPTIVDFSPKRPGPNTWTCHSVVCQETFIEVGITTSATPYQVAWTLLAVQSSTPPSWEHQILSKQQQQQQIFCSVCTLRGAHEDVYECTSLCSSRYNYTCTYSKHAYLPSESVLHVFGASFNLHSLSS